MGFGNKKSGTKNHHHEELDDFEYIDLDADEEQDDFELVSLNADMEASEELTQSYANAPKTEVLYEPEPENILKSNSGKKHMELHSGRAESEEKFKEKSEENSEDLEIEDLSMEDFDDFEELEADDLNEDEIEAEIEAEIPAGTKKHSFHSTGKKVKSQSAAADYSVSERIRAFVEKKIANFSKMDWIICGMGVLILAAALAVVGIWLVRSNSSGQKAATMAQTGQELVDIGIAGQSGLMAVTDAQLAKQADILPEEPDITQEPDENEIIEVKVTFTSVEKDLKIKFVNNNTGKLINNAKFTVTLTDSSGKEKEYADDDMDGIIYNASMTPGEYQVSVEVPENYEIVICDSKVKVRDTIVYEQVDVADEIKSESEVNVATEDASVNVQIQEEVVTGNLTDTVEWVESTKTLIAGEGDYSEIQKSAIMDPAQIVSRTFLAMTMQVVNDSVGEITQTDTPTNTPTDTPTPTAEPTPMDTPTPTQPAVTITEIEVKIDPSSVSMKVGETTTLSASVTVKKSDNTSASGEYTWSSSDTSIATVSGGTVEAVKAGTATITVTSKDTVNGNVKTAACTITVSDVTYVKSISLDQTSVTVAIGDTVTLKPTVTMSDNTSDTTGKDITWSSSDTNIAKVEGGRITPVAAGKATITASYKDSSGNTVQAQCSVTVNAALSVKLDQEKATVAVGAKIKLTATVNKNGTATTSGTEGIVTWSTSDKSIATVDEKTGEVTGVKAGTVTITATTVEKDASGNQIKAACTVTVTNGTLEIKLDKDKLTMYTEAKTTLVATVIKNGVTLTSATEGVVTWSASDKSIATVNEKTGEITAVKAGTVTITATTVDKNSEGKQISVSCTVTVKNDPSKDKVSKLLDKNGNQVYILDASGKYTEATYADYYTAAKFYIRVAQQYKYTGWQTIDNRTYYFDKNGVPVTGEQIIQGVKYNFASDGALSMGDGTFGIDVSKWNGNIDWNAVRNSGVSFVIIRCGYRGSTKGALVEDSAFRRNIEGATAAGLKVGIYFFTQAVNEVEAVEEASMVLSLVKNYKISYPIFIDTEACGGRADKISRETRTAVCRAFCETIRNGGYTAGIYASKSWFTDNLNVGSLNSYKIWLAQYATTPTYTGRYDLWQYSSKGKINGISGDVDLNYSYLGY